MMNQDFDIRLDRLKPFAVIDIGSNTVRLVVFEGLTRSPTQLHNESVTCRLGSGVARTGRIREDNAALALESLRRFSAIIRNMRVKTFRPFATAAVRAAENGPDFIESAQRICKCEIEVLSPEREAELTAMGILSGFHGAPDGIAGDIGGRSLELVNIKHGVIQMQDPAPVSLSLGHLHMTEQFEQDFAAARIETDRSLAAVDWLQSGQQRNFYAIGGEWRALARLHMSAKNYPLRIFHGYEVPAGDMIQFARELITKPDNEVPGIDQLSRSRRETVRHAALVLSRTLKALGSSRIVISAFGVREGLLYSLLEDKERARDPLIAACEEAAVTGGRSLAYVRELCAWTDMLFAEVGLDETTDERRLRHAACLLSDVGWRAHPDYRGEQSLNLSAHWAVAGTNHEGRAFIALANYYRHEGSLKGEASPIFRQLFRAGEAGERLRKRARILGSAMRSAYIISAGTTEVIIKTPLQRIDGKLVLSLPRELHEFDGDRLRQRLAQLGNILGFETQVRLIDRPGGTQGLISAIAERLR
jgi:exopolyphosphatase/guanosine-5'-triphosphate,3'-diphosphate pyrophosphatase